MKIDYQFINAFDSEIYWDRFGLSRTPHSYSKGGSRCFGHDIVVLYLLNHPEIDEKKYDYFGILFRAEKEFGVKISGQYGDIMTNAKE